MATTVEVHVQLGAETHRVGTLWTNAKNGRETATFEYDLGWLKARHRFALDPALPLGRGAYHTMAGQTMFAAIGDSAPDRWGRTLMRRAEIRAAKDESRQPRTLLESDYLLGVGDNARLGALRYRLMENGPFLNTGGPRIAPVIIELKRLLAASDRIDQDKETDADLDLLLRPGTSLGGARPKASLYDKDEGYLVAKFPKQDDTWNVVAWERVAMKLARAAGVDVPRSRLVNVAKRQVLIVERFDRGPGDTRIPFMSAMSMLGAKDNEARSYLEVMDGLRQNGASPLEDGKQLWRRIVFNILISNTDDHLRNHALLYTVGRGWKLSPAYDLNPFPIDVKSRELATAINEADHTASLAIAYEVAPAFGLKADTARQVVGEVGASVKQWREVARSVGIRESEVNRMASAFEHEDLRQAVDLAAGNRPTFDGEWNDEVPGADPPAETMTPP